MRKIPASIAIACCAVAYPALSAAQAQTVTLVDTNFGSGGAWALETDAAFVLTRGGCLETLGRIDNDGQLQPGLAISWTQTAPTAWDFKLRDGVTFQDGAKLDAQAVVTALQHLLSATVPARSFSPKVVASIEAVDDMTVRVNTTAPNVILPYHLASPNTGILSPAAYSGETVNPVGTCTGPFTITAADPQQSITLTRNDAYWGGAVGLAGAEVRFIPDGTVRATLVRTGEAQIAIVIPVSLLESLKSDPEVMVIQHELPRTTSLYINNAKPPLDDVRVRQAIQSALDLEAIVAAVYEGAARPAIGPFAPDEPWAPATTPVPLDVERAKALLAEAGIAPDTLTLGLIAYNERPEFKDVAAVIQEELKAIGIGVEIRQADYPAIEPDLLSGNFDLALLSRGHIGDVADPLNFLTADYSCAGTYNITHFCDPEVDAALEKAAGLADPAERFEIYRQIGEMLQTEAVDAFLIHEQGIDVVSTSVKNFVMHPLGQYAITSTLTVE